MTIHVATISFRENWQGMIIGMVDSPYIIELFFIIIHFPLHSISIRVLQVRVTLDNLYRSISINDKDGCIEALTFVAKCPCNIYDLLEYGILDVIDYVL